METAFAAAKAALVTAVPLAHPLPGAVLALATDASNTHVRAVVIQTGGSAIFFFSFKGTPSKDQQKTYRCRLTPFKVTLTSQSHFADFFDSVRSLYAVTATL